MSQFEQQTKANLHILFVEDNANDIFLTEHALVAAGYSGDLTHAHDGLEAIYFLEGVLDNKEKAPDIVIMDINLPRMNGIQTLEWIREQEKFKTLPVVLLTAHVEMRDLTKTKRLGVFHFLTKQVHYDDLIRTLDNYVKTLSIQPVN